MTDLVLLEEETALDLPVKGSVGSFSVRTADGATSVEVRYLQTHVGFATSGDSEEKLLRELVPVREALPLNTMSFEEIMQRDIDDGRVSADLIPYLLDENAHALVKFFPPIIVVVLPMAPDGRPASRYPSVRDRTVEAPAEKAKWSITTSGDVGAEAFEFKQLILKGKPQPHDYAQLKINSTKCKLAIVDGQHRAMALLALYRNLKGWPDKTGGYRDYYQRWSPSVINQYDLSEIRLPLVLCTFPKLDEDYGGQLTVAEACRSIFLALNKNAKPVSRSRNHLLDDGDLIAHFLRETLEQVKKLDAASDRAIRLWNAELDAEENNVALSNPMAITGVMHLYSLVERMMLADPARGVSLKRQNLWKIKQLDAMDRRLDIKHHLGKKKANSLNRQNIDREAAEKLCLLFGRSYGATIIEALDRFWPYEAHNRESIALEVHLRDSAKSATYHSILFGGQGIAQVFDRYVERLRDLKKESGAPELLETYNAFQTKKKELQDILDDFYLKRASRFLGNGVSKAAVSHFRPYVDTLYRHTFTTAAFQIGIVLSFWNMMERLVDDRERAKTAPPDIKTRVEWFTDYVEQLNRRFFKPNSTKAALELLRVFIGPTEGGHNNAELKVVASPHCLKKILVPGELKPDEWVKFKYIFLELWEPADSELAAIVAKEVEKCRGLVSRNFINLELRRAAARQGVDEDALPEQQAESIRNTCRSAFAAGVKSLGKTIDVAALKEGESAASREVATVTEDADDESEALDDLEVTD